MTNPETVAEGLTRAQREALIAEREGAWSEREQKGFPAEMFSQHGADLPTCHRSASPSAPSSRKDSPSLPRPTLSAAP